ncbi:MAG: potassium channel family protein [Thermoleophilia bacterium]|nr:potassium channel family protein [Thermoleophilia bacterium]
MSALRPSRGWLRVAVPAAVVTVLLAGGGLAAVETETVSSYADGVLWALSLMTTVGFVGGIPHTAVGKLIAAGLMLFGFALLAMTTAAVASLFVSEVEAPADERERAFEDEVLRELRALNARLDALEDRRVAPQGREAGSGATAGSG